MIGLQELQDFRAEGHEEEARGVRVRLGRSPGIKHWIGIIIRIIT